MANMIDDARDEQPPYEIRIGRRVPPHCAEHARQIAAHIHQRIPLASVRIYNMTEKTYYLTILPAGRATLVCMNVRVRLEVETMATKYANWLVEISRKLDKADQHRKKPLFIERVMPVLLYEHGDGQYFHTMMIKAARRRDILYPANETQQWGDAQLSRDIILTSDDKGVPIINCHKRDFSIQGQKLRLKGAKAIGSIEDAAGKPLDEVLNDYRINGRGLTVGKWVKQVGAQGSDHYLVDLQSDLMPITEAAALVDDLRTRNDVRGIGYPRTPAYTIEPGYTPAPGTRLEDSGICNKFDRNQQDDLARLVKPIAEQAPLEPVAAALLAENGLEETYRQRVESEQKALNAEAEPPFCFSFKQHGMEGCNDILTYNLTPWLREATAEEVVKCIHAIFGHMDGDRSILLSMAQRCHKHRDGKADPKLEGLDILITPNRHDGYCLVEVLQKIKPEIATLAEQTIANAQKIREDHYDEMSSEIRGIREAA